jgi:hypothetical protein
MSIRPPLRITRQITTLEQVWGNQNLAQCFCSHGDLSLQRFAKPLRVAAGRYVPPKVNMKTGIRIE